MALLLGLLAIGVFGSSLTIAQKNPAAKGGVVTNGHECAGFGRDMLEKGGSAVDAAIAALLCEGVSNPESTGLGGGFLMTIYNKESGVVESLISRETAPAGASEKMFANDPRKSLEGGLAVAIPGELRGFEEAHKKYGKLPWADLFEPTIKLCKNGIKVTKYLADVFVKYKDMLMENPSLKEIFVNPLCAEPFEEGDLVKRPTLAKTLKIFAEEGASALYDGSLTEKFVQDIADFGGIITVKDMNDYSARWSEPVTIDLPGKQTLYTAPLPGSGLVLSFILNLVKDYLNTNDVNDVTNWQRIVESLKFGYGQRTQLGDSEFIEGIQELINNLTSNEFVEETRSKILDNQTFNDPNYYDAHFNFTEDHGTAHISVLAPNGDAVSVTSTINYVFGAQRRSPSTGIILNNEMDDFSSSYSNSYDLPPSPANFIKPGKRPMSSMCPSIILDSDRNVRLVIGAAGGSKITSSVAQVVIKHLWFGQNLDLALNGKRLHHQLFPMLLSFENGYKKEIVDGLKNVGHTIEMIDLSKGFSAVTGIANVNGAIEVVCDSRRTGSEIYVS